MEVKDFLKNDRGVSISVGFILMFAITVLVFSAVLLSFYGVSTYSEKSATRESFRILGNNLAIKITTVDTLVNVSSSFGGIVDSLSYEFLIPATLAGKSYSVNITNSTYEIILESDNGVKIVVPFSISVNFTERKIYSGADYYVLKYDGGNRVIYMDER